MVAGWLKRVVKLNRRFYIALASLLILIAMTTGVAYAHYVYNSGWTYWSSTDCVWERSETSHGGGGGYTKSDLESWRNLIYPPANCSITFDRPPNYIKLRYDWEKWDESTSNWVVCAYVGWQYNSSTTWHFQLSYDFGSTPWCGSGQYATDTEGYELNGDWHGGAMWSGSHYLPP